eukprot:126045-Rhodomonas_salina.2
MPTLSACAFRIEVSNLNRDTCLQVNSSAGPSTPVGGVKSKFFSRNSNAFKSMAVLSHSFGKPRAGSADEGSAGGDGAEEYKVRTLFHVDEKPTRDQP